MSTQHPPENVPVSQTGQPAWEVATLFPVQGEWTEDEFFALETSHFIELADGHIEVLPMPTWLHQLTVKCLVQQLESWVGAHAKGTVLFAPLPLRLFPKTVREPDILYFSPSNIPDDVRGYPRAADLVMEVVSDSPRDRHRDLVTKRGEYAPHGIREYWIVDPREKKISVLTLQGDTYSTAGDFAAGETAKSLLLDGFGVETSAIWALENRESS